MNRNSAVLSSFPLSTREDNIFQTFLQLQWAMWSNVSGSEAYKHILWRFSFLFLCHSHWGPCIEMVESRYGNTLIRLPNPPSEGASFLSELWKPLQTPKVKNLNVLSNWDLGILLSHDITLFILNNSVGKIGNSMCSKFFSLDCYFLWLIQ